MPVYTVERKIPDTSGELIGLEQQADEGHRKMEEPYHSKSCKKSHWSYLEIGLIAAVCLLLVALAVLIALIVIYNQNEVCTTADCIKSAARVIEYMDTTVDPCENFYQYSCGGWMKKNVIPEASSRYSTFEILRDNLDVVLKDILEKTVEGELPALTKAKTLYQSCMNESAIEERGGTPLINILPDVLDWPMGVDNWEATYGKKWRMEDMIAKLSTKYALPVLVNFYIGIDDKESSSYIIHFDQQKGSTMSSGTHYKCTGPYAAICQVYRQFITKLVKLIRTDRGLAINEHRITQQVTRYLELERDISHIMDTTEERNIPSHGYNKMELGDLNRKFTLKFESQKFNWTYFTAKIMDTVNISIPETTKVLNYAPNYFRKLNNILSKYTKRDLQNYMVGRFVISMVSSLGQAYKNIMNDFIKVIWGTTAELALWQNCVGFVKSNMMDAVGRLYVQETFSESSKEMMLDMIKDLRQAFINDLHELTWMDAKTKKAAEVKAKAIRELIGYPDWIMNDEYLTAEYKDLSFSADQYFENSLKNLENTQKRRLRKIKYKVNKNSWVNGAAVVNSFYSTIKNHIVFPAGMLQPPFFCENQSKSLNYGSIGTIIGHEITHGFDDNGRYYDKEGNLKDWWTPESNREFMKLAKCMVNQYNNFVLNADHGIHVNGNVTLGENIADNGGLRQAFEAYKNHVKVYGEEALLPGIDLSHYQLFFVSFGQTWCAKYRPEEIASSLSTQMHSPSNFRVMGSLQNYPEFAKTFNCKKGSIMVPEKPCRVW